MALRNYNCITWAWGFTLMMLGTHTIVGAAVSRLFPKSPITAFIAGFISHFLIDAIPHWDYDLKSFSYHPKHPNDPMHADMKMNKKFAVDLITIGIDILAGFVLSIYFFQTNISFDLSLLLGALGGIFPDVLQFVYFKTRVEPLRTLQKFHVFIQTKKDGSGKRLLKKQIFENNTIAGFASQASFSALIILFSKIFIH